MRARTRVHTHVWLNYANRNLGGGRLAKGGGNRRGQKEGGAGTEALGSGQDLTGNSRHSDALCEGVGTAFLRPGRPGPVCEVVCALRWPLRGQHGCFGDTRKGGMPPSKAAGRVLAGSG